MGEHDDLQALLNKLGLVLVCPNCGKTEWSTVRGDLAIHNATGSTHHLLLIRCDHCGHQRFFSPDDPGGEPKSDNPPL